MSQLSSVQPGASAPENYERFFVPAVAAPLALELLKAATLRRGERVLDLACGTGVLARQAAEQVGVGGKVAAVDVNPGMLAVARASVPSQSGVQWQAASAESLPFTARAFDVAVCQFGLQFFPDKVSALREVRRVLADDGRLVLNVPGPTPAIFAVMEEELERHVGPQAASFVRAVFSLCDTAEIRELLHEAGFGTASVRSKDVRLLLPRPAVFLWEYLLSTPLADAVAGADDDQRVSLEHSVTERWKPLTNQRRLVLDLGVTTAVARA
ncbi:MAG: class I SAM-dependent methyltransferase [Actinomycetes bacterium]